MVFNVEKTHTHTLCVPFLTQMLMFPLFLFFQNDVAHVLLGCSHGRRDEDVFGRRGSAPGGFVAVALVRAGRGSPFDRRPGPWRQVLIYIFIKLFLFCFVKSSRQAAS